MAHALTVELVRECQRLDRRVTPHPLEPWGPQASPESWPATDRLAALRQQQISALSHVFRDLEANRPVTGWEFFGTVDSLMEHLRACPARFGMLASFPCGSDDYLPCHAYKLAVLALAAARQLCWSLEDARRVGLSAMFCDVGMLVVPLEVRAGSGELSDLQRSGVLQHPMAALPLSRDLELLDPIVLLAALQHHERDNGSGYPHGSGRSRICDHARLLAVADVFAAATEPRPYRPAKLPHTAIEELIRAALSGQLWPKGVQAFLQAVGLFPVGSYVRLWDGRCAQVVAANPRHIGRPVVQPLSADCAPDGPEIDLARTSREQAIQSPLESAAG